MKTYMFRALTVTALLMVVGMMGCTTAQLQQAANKLPIPLSDVQGIVARQCPVVQGFMMAIQANPLLTPQAQAYLQTAQSVNNEVCSIAESNNANLTVAQIQAFVAKGIPAVVQLIASAGWTPQQVTAADIAVAAAQVAINEALVNLAPVATFPEVVPVSAPVAASATK